MDVPVRAGAVLFRHLLILFRVANSDETGRHPSLGHAQLFQNHIMFPIQRTTQRVAQLFIDNSQHDVFRYTP